MEYPKNKLEIVVLSDCPTDRTNEIIAEYSFQELLLLETVNNYNFYS